ncbi:MAG: ABC transporter permease [Anaerolineae bacterium]
MAPEGSKGQRPDQEPHRSRQGQPVALSVAQDLEKRRRRAALRRLIRNQSVIVGLVITVTLAILSVGAPLFTDVDPTDLNVRKILKPPDAESLFGTDDYGRDLFSRVLYGSRVTFAVGLEVAILTTVAGLFLGTLAGFYRQFDNVIMRFLDILMSFPALLMAIGVVAILGPQLFNIVIALVIPLTPRGARVVRASILELRETEFVVAARSVGAGDLRIMLRHLLPNCMAPLLVQQTYTLALAMLSESGLSFLGVGLPPDVPSLGTTLSVARTYLRSAPWMSFYPGVFISLLVLGFNVLGDGLRDVLDPRMAGK